MRTILNCTPTEPVSEGSGTVVYRGYAEGNQAAVLIKTLKSEYPTPREVATLRHEYTILKSLDVPGVVKPLALERRNNSLQLVLEYVDGSSLHDLIEQGRIELKTVLEMGAALASILASVHQRHVTHKDIKPHNILVNTKTHQVTLIDFGIATQLPQETARVTSPAMIEGTLAYMSPEQTGRMNRAIDHRTDFYSLGATLYESLVGRLPFTVTDPVKLIHSHIARRPASPAELVPEIPLVVSDIVMKLLSKAAEDRYRTAKGLEADLRECLKRLEATGTIAPFPLGQHDLPSELRIPQKLYGREKEEKALWEAFERVSRGACELLLVSGYSGIGKSVLVHEIHKHIARTSGNFIAGKFDQLNRSTPYAALSHSLRELCQQILTEPTAAFAHWQQSLTTALGTNGQLLIDLVPELELIIGAQPSVPALGPTESQNRFMLVLQNFLEAVATSEHPLVLFLDDLQWVDSASLKILNAALTNPAGTHLLVIGAYRDNEIDPSHLLPIAVDELRRAGATIHEMMLAPLLRVHVGHIVAEALDSTMQHVEPLADIVFGKTRGNPFFINQFLGLLYTEKLLAFDVASGRWAWDIERIRAAEVTENVVHFMLGKLQRLAPATQRVLSLAACIGHRFDLQTLATTAQLPQRATAGNLWQALQEGLVVPLDPEYRLMNVEARAPGEAADDDAPASPPTFPVTYRFLHDRVQQAAYALIDDAKKQDVHLQIGRLMRAKWGDQAREEELFDVANHLNIGAPLITGGKERLELARMNLAAGQKAKTATAYSAAAAYFNAGAALLGDEAWEQHYDLTFALRAGQAESELSTGQYEAAKSLLDVLLSHVKSRAERTRVLHLCSARSVALGRFRESVDFLLAALRLFGLEFPETEQERAAALDREMAEIESALAKRSFDELLNAPVAADPDIEAATGLMTRVVFSSYSVSPTLAPLISMRRIRIALTSGNFGTASDAYMGYACLLVLKKKEYEKACEFGRLALALNERFHHAAIAAKLYLTFGSFVHVRKPLRLAHEYCTKSRDLGFSSGDLSSAFYACCNLAMLRFSQGDELDAVLEEIEKYLKLVQRTKFMYSSEALTAQRQLIRSLTGAIKDRNTLEENGFVEKEFIHRLEAANLLPLVCLYYTAKLQAMFLYGHYNGALSALAQAEPRAKFALLSYFPTEIPFYGSLTLLALYPDATSDEQARYRDMLDRYERDIADWAESCPENFLHKHLLVRAERARVEGMDLEAVDLYDKAIASAHENDFTHLVALGNELCAKHYMAKRKTTIARAYMTEAHYGYFRWGAIAKTTQLQERYPHLLFQMIAVPRHHQARLSPGSLFGSITQTGKSVAELIDVVAVVRAAQAVAGETVLEKVLEHIMRIVIENAGAQRGVLLLVRGDRLMVEATATVEPDAVCVGSGIPVEDSTGIAKTIVQYVRRTGEPVILGDATRDPQFSNDPHIVTTRPKSISCHAMAHQTRLTGILYLENRDTANAFTSARVELLSLLSSQAAIAVENALLYADVQIVTRELRETNQRLTFELAERERGEKARQQAEAERAALQEQMIQAQSERLSELSTPLIPITSRIMTMPLIGTIDAKRAQHILETALTGTQSSQARVVILDITGVKRVDMGVASTLVRAAEALRLLGAEVVITGIGPEVAQTFIHLNIDLGAIVTRGNLQSGIAWALARTGEAKLLAR